MIRTCVFNSLHYCIKYFNFVVIRIYKFFCFFFIADRDFVHKDIKMNKQVQHQLGLGHHNHCQGKRKSSDNGLSTKNAKKI